MTFSALVREVAEVAIAINFVEDGTGDRQTEKQRLAEVCAELDRRWDALDQAASAGAMFARAVDRGGEP